MNTKYGMQRDFSQYNLPCGKEKNNRHFLVTVLYMNFSEWEVKREREGKSERDGGGGGERKFVQRRVAVSFRRRATINKRYMVHANLQHR